MTHQEPDLRIAKVGVSVIAVGGSLLFPSVMAFLKLPILALVIVFLGIPHGALDHIIGQKLLHEYDFKSARALFYVVYLSFATLMGFLWLISPVVAFVVFLACAVYHFGEADLNPMQGSPFVTHGLYVSRGLMIMGLLVFSYPTITHPLILDISGLSIYSISPSINVLQMVGVLLGIQYVLLLVIYIYSFRINYRWALHLLGDTLLLFILFLTTPSLLAFAVYFGVWHSTTHISRIKKFFKDYGNSLNVQGFYRKAISFTLPLLIILIAALLISPASVYDARAVTILFVLISIITFPHVFLVRWMYLKMNRGEVDAEYTSSATSGT